MDPSEEVILERVHPEKKPHIDGETRGRSPMPISAAVFEVLNGDHLLIEILLRVDFPTTLVRAALVCRRWLHHASDHGFLRRFHELHPPRLLGFYVKPHTLWGSPSFVPVLNQPRELAAVIRRARSSFDAYRIDGVSTDILDCRNGSVLIQHFKDRIGYTFGVHSLLCPERGMAIMPPYPRPQLQRGSFYSCHKILSKEEDDGGLSYLHVMLYFMEGKQIVYVYMLQNGVWCLHRNWCVPHSLSIEHRPYPLPEQKPVLVDNKIYMLASRSKIIVLDLMASSTSTIQMPQGLEHDDRNIILSRAHDAIGVYLIHVKKFVLCIWLHKGDDWLLVDTIYLGEMCACLDMLNFSDFPRIMGARDNAEFVLLEIRRCALYLDIKCRAMQKVYETTKEERWLGNIFPFMMIWPPMFPVLKDDLARFASSTWGMHLWPPFDSPSVVL